MEEATGAAAGGDAVDQASVEEENISRLHITVDSSARRQESGHSSFHQSIGGKSVS